MYIQEFGQTQKTDLLHSRLRLIGTQNAWTFCSNYPNVPIVKWLTFVRINHFPLVMYRAIVYIKWRVPINRMPINRSRLYIFLFHRLF